MNTHGKRTLDYLKKHETMLRERAAFRRYFQGSAPFYSMFNTAEYTLAPYKVVWAEQGDFGYAVIEPSGGKTLVPDHKIMMIPFDEPDEAYYVCALGLLPEVEREVDELARQAWGLTEEELDEVLTGLKEV